MSTARDLVIVGASGHGREVLQLVEDINAAASAPAWNVLGFLDDEASRVGSSAGGCSVLGTTDWLRDAGSSGPAPPVVALGIGLPAAKARVLRRPGLQGREFATLVHPTAVAGPRVRLGRGTMVSAGCILTTDIHVGDFVTLNIGTTVSHDTRIADFATLAPGVHVSGSVHIDEGADLGTGSSTIQGVRIGRWSTLGAGGVVTRDLPPNVVAVGVPARPIRTRDEGWHLG